MPVSLLAQKARAAVVHAAITAAFGALVAAVIFGLWYPGAYRVLAGGTQLFLLVLGVDLVLGPLLTFVVFNLAKPRAELVRDLVIIATLQLAALAYGVWTTAAARPTHLAFEVDLFRVVAAAEIEPETLGEAPPELQHLPWTGPITIGAVKPTDPKEIFDSIVRGLAGEHLAATPRYWRPYEQVRGEVVRRALPLVELKLRDAAQREQLESALRGAGLAEPAARWLPVVSRFATFIALIDSNGHPVAIVPVHAP